MKKNRPLSPHLSIYKAQISSVLSITHRVSGIILLLGSILMSWLIAASVFYPEIWECSCINSCVIKFMIFGWTIMLFFHLLNGIRHLFWDAGYGFDIKTMNKTGMLVVILTAILTCLFYFY